EPAPLDTCRVLELGCGDGSHLIPMALTLPRARFVGVDLAEAPIAAAEERAGRLGLANAEFRRLDVLKIGADFGEFDYIVTHGLYSWVPEPVRDKLLAICKANLAPHGVAFVSYNAYPGRYLRQMLREMLLYHTGGIEDSGPKLQRAYELIGFLDRAGTGHPELREELRALNERDPFAIFHDDLADINQPVYFHEFMEHAGRHGLQFLAEAQFSSMQEGQFSAGTVEALNRFANGDKIRKQQYLDFLKCRRFHQTLLCHERVRLSDAPEERSVQRLWASSAAHPAGPATSDGEMEFRAADGASMKTNLPLAQSALLHLSAAWPRAVSFEELRRETGAQSSGDAATLSNLLLRTYAAGLIELHAMPSPFTTVAGERPRAFRLARLEAETGTLVTTLRHTSVELDDPLVRRLLCLLDGTRDRAALLSELRVFAPDAKDSVSAESLERNLDAAAKGALLEA
ncbi:MAG: class I SAM-dependent methyltransferase, partial [Bryobacteraceae bacterium]